jgi:hypothetical protein
MCLILWLFSLQLVYLLKNTDYFYEIAILIAPLLDGFRPKKKKKNLDVEILWKIGIAGSFAKRTVL